MQPKALTTVALVDDHALFRQGIAGLIDGFEGYKIIHQSGNGREFMEHCRKATPEIALVDFQMPVMDGEQTALWVRQHQPGVKVLALSMYDDEQNILKMVKAGAKGYLLKNAEPLELKNALDQVSARGVYHSELVSSVMMKNFTQPVAAMPDPAAIVGKELEFLRLACSELTYKEIAEQMHISERTVDSYREHLFAKFNIKSRVGLVLFAVRNKLIRV